MSQLHVSEQRELQRHLAHLAVGLDGIELGIDVGDVDDAALDHVYVELSGVDGGFRHVDGSSRFRRVLREEWEGNAPPRRGACVVARAGLFTALDGNVDHRRPPDRGSAPLLTGADRVRFRPVRWQAPSSGAVAEWRRLRLPRRRPRGSGSRTAGPPPGAPPGGLRSRSGASRRTTRAGGADLRLEVHSGRVPSTFRALSVASLAANPAARCGAGSAEEQLSVYPGPVNTRRR